MKILLNGKKISIQNTKISDLILELGFKDAFIGVALNGEVIPKLQHGETDVCEGDKIEIIAPLQGG